MLKNILKSFQKITFHPKNGGIKLVILGIIILASIIRIGLYGDPKLSIASNDTLSYVESSRVPFFSKEMMSGRRLLTTNLLYKALESEKGYEILVNGSIETTKRKIQPGFNQIVVLQLGLSIAGWGLLAFMISEFIRNPLLKILSAVTILLFAFTPQMADWDSILMSESLTFSLFALQAAVLIKITFSIYNDPNSKVLPYIILWVSAYVLWTFLKDTNLFASLVTAGLTVPLLWTAKYKKNKYLLGTLAVVAAIFLIGLVTAANSTRSQVQIINIYNDDFLRSPARVNTLRELGMPEPNSEEYKAWFQENSTSTLIKFMLIHPGYPITKVLKDFPFAFTEIKQTYFNAPEQGQTRETLMGIGNTLHPENATPFLMSLFFMIGLIILAVKNTSPSNRPWAWIGSWLFLTASITIIPTILGDTWALNRHALFSTMLYRLFMWVFAFVIMDMAIGQSLQKNEPLSHDLN